VLLTFLCGLYMVIGRNPQNLYGPQMNGMNADPWGVPRTGSFDRVIVRLVRLL